MPFISTRDGTNLYVKSWGEGRPVILTHGWPLNADMWDPQAMALAEAGFRAIAYDRRGFGRSDQPWTGYDYDTLGDDLRDVMAATGATSDATIVGFSMGGGEVARYMSRHGGQGVIAAAWSRPSSPICSRTAATQTACRRRNSSRSRPASSRTAPASSAAPSRRSSSASGM